MTLILAVFFFRICARSRCREVWRLATAAFAIELAEADKAPVASLRHFHPSYSWTILIGLSAIIDAALFTSSIKAYHRNYCRLFIEPMTARADRRIGHLQQSMDSIYIVVPNDVIRAETTGCKLYK